MSRSILSAGCLALVACAAREVTPPEPHPRVSTVEVDAVEPTAAAETPSGEGQRAFVCLEVHPDHRNPYRLWRLEPERSRGTRVQRVDVGWGHPVSASELRLAGSATRDRIELSSPAASISVHQRLADEVLLGEVQASGMAAKVVCAAHEPAAATAVCIDVHSSAESFFVFDLAVDDGAPIARVRGRWEGKELARTEPATVDRRDGAFHAEGSTLRFGANYPMAPGYFGAEGSVDSLHKIKLVCAVQDAAST